MISLSDPVVRSIALQESHEGFVDLAGFHNRIAVDPGHDGAAHASRHFLKVRDGVAQRLIAAAHALPDEDTLVALTSHYVAPPEVAAHPTGAAVDLTLISTDGVALDMGCVLDATDQESSGACYTHNPFISRAAARNRQVLISALTGAGFTNYPSEWWHWSFGDRYWAVMHNQSHAIYGPVEESMLDEAAR